MSLPDVVKFDVAGTMDDGPQQREITSFQPNRSAASASSSSLGCEYRAVVSSRL